MNEVYGGSRLKLTHQFSCQASSEQQSMNCVYYTVCDVVGDMFSQDGVPQTYQLVGEISKNTGIRWSSVGRVIHDLFGATHAEENRRPVWLLMHSPEV